MRVPVMVWQYAALLALAGSAASAQGLRVYSEFVRVGPDGEIAAPDRGGKPREIISPAVLKNSHLTLRVAIESPPGVPYYLHIGQNPEKLMEATLYQEQYEQSNGGYIPDRLIRMDLPHGAKLAEGQKVQTYLLDVFVLPKTPMTRIRLELQLNVGDRWTIYPMEIRVRDRAGFGGGRPLGPLPAVRARADAAIVAPLREMYCGDARSRRGPVELDTARALLVRNIREDLAIAREKAKTEGPGVAAMLMKAGGWDSPEAFCQAKGSAPGGAEWWMRARNYLYQGLPVR